MGGQALEKWDCQALEDCWTRIWECAPCSLCQSRCAGTRHQQHPGPAWLTLGLCSPWTGPLLSTSECQVPQTYSRPPTFLSKLSRPGPSVCADSQVHLQPTLPPDPPSAPGVSPRLRGSQRQHIQTLPPPATQATHTERLPPLPTHLSYSTCLPRPGPSSRTAAETPSFLRGPCTRMPTTAKATI